MINNNNNNNNNNNDNNNRNLGKCLKAGQLVKL